MLILIGFIIFRKYINMSILNIFNEANWKRVFVHVLYE